MIVLHRIYSREVHLAPRTNQYVSRAADGDCVCAELYCYVVTMNKWKSKSLSNLYGHGIYLKKNAKGLENQQITNQNWQFQGPFSGSTRDTFWVGDQAILIKLWTSGRRQTAQDLNLFAYFSAVLRIFRREEDGRIIIIVSQFQISPRSIQKCLS